MGTLSFTYNITVVHHWQDSLCDQTLEIITTGEWRLFAVCPIPLGLSKVEVYTLMSVTKHGVHSNKSLL